MAEDSEFYTELKRSGLIDSNEVKDVDGDSDAIGVS